MNYHYGYRYYDPVTGRWPSRDPFGNGGNLYEMVGNCATNWSDNLRLEKNALDKMVANGWKPRKNKILMESS